MKKSLFLLFSALFLSFALCLTACNTDGEKKLVSPSEIWQGVEGNEIKFDLASAGDSITVVLDRSGSCYVYTEYGDTMTGDDFNRPELDAEMGMYPTYYGAYEVKDGVITATLDTQTYYRFFAWGKDAKTLLDLCFETNFSEDQREGYYGKGIIRYEEKGTTVIVCNYEGNTYTVKALTIYDENKTKISESVPNEDGSYKNTAYYPDGAVAEIRDYDNDGDLVRKEVYGKDGKLEYVESSVYEEGRSVTTRTDADGNVVRTEERTHKNHENGGYLSEAVIIENGVTVYHNLIDERCDKDGLATVSYNLLEEVDGNRKVYNVSYTDHKDGNNNYTLSKEYADDVLTYYYCAIERVTVIEGVSGRQNVTYSTDSGKYSHTIEYVDETGMLVGRGYDYSVDEYVHGEWENFEYVIE